MNNESRKREIGHMVPEKDYEVFTWKISNVSSIPHTVDYVLKSPPFSFAGATWIFKMYPYGQTEYKSEGYIDVIIERFHSQIAECQLHCEIYCKNCLDKEVQLRSGTFTFELKFPWARLLRLIKNVKEYPNKWKFVLNDVFTFVCAFERKNQTLSRKNQTLSGPDCTPVDSAAVNTDVIGIKETGEILKGSYMRKYLWKIFHVSSFAFPKDYQVQSPPFTQANASWILKLYPCFRKEQSNELSFYVVLERLHSEIPQHYVTYIMSFSENDSISDSSIFNSCRRQGNAIHFQLGEHFGDMVYIHVDLFVNNARLELDSLRNLYKPDSYDNTLESSIMLQNNKVLQDYKELYLTQSDCDVIIKVKDQEFSAHRAILKARSPVLASTFRCDMKEKATGIVDIEDCDPSVFSDFLCFLYCGELENLSVETVYSLFTIADKYDVPDLRSKCIKFIKQNLSVDIFCESITLALLHSEAELKELCIDFFTKNLQDIIVTVKWQSFIIENPIQGNELIIKALVPDKK